ncbi:hypothetical protein LCGC14_2540070 [marine sediment metagenome]|uniref:Uncharacterized protein n=1 Tax=marine sediment metagenome TaxID=412755 RepID=A0A0F9AR00_9ZZZZ
MYTDQLKELRLLRTRLFHESDMLETTIAKIETSLERLNNANLRLQKAEQRIRMFAKQAEINEALIKDIIENGLPNHLK